MPGRRKVSRQLSVSRHIRSMRTWLRKWMRQKGGGPDQPPGMGEEFHKFDAVDQSRSISMSRSVSKSGSRRLGDLFRQPRSEVEELRDQIKSLKMEIDDLGIKVVELETQRNLQNEMKRCFRLKAITLGEALRNCRQVAIDRGVDPAILGVDVRAETPCDASKNELEQPADPSELDDSSLPPRIIKLRRKAKKNGWFIQPTEVVLNELVGEGATANIYKAQWRGLDVAVKCIFRTQLEETVDGIDKFCQELELISRQRHPYVLRLLGASLMPPDYAWLVTEYLPRGTLMEWLHGDTGRTDKRTVPLPPLSERIRVALEISQGMEYLHEQKPKILHRDLKPSNVFMDEHLHPRIADFGFGRTLQPTSAVMTGEIGTYIYMAPEVMRHDHYDEKCDVFSFGIMLCEMLTGDRPYSETKYSAVQIASSVANGTLRPTLPTSSLQPGLIQLTVSAWSQEPSQRPHFSYITATLKGILRDLLLAEKGARHSSAGEQITEIIQGLLKKKHSSREEP